MSKITLRIPTKEPYAYIEEVYEGENIKGRYNELYSLMNEGQKVSETAFNDIIVKIADSDLTEWQMDADFYQTQLTDSQKKVIQSLKKFLKRLPINE